MSIKQNRTCKTGQRSVGPRAALLLCALLLGACTDVSLTALNSLARLGDYQLVSDLSYGPDPLNRLDIYIPDYMPGYMPDKAGAQIAPTIVFFYGGCWGGCQTWPKEDYRFVAEALTSAGFVAVLADYRLHPQVKFPEIMEDAAGAVNWVAQHIGDYGGDEQRIYLMGHSAGAQMAAMLTLNADYLAEDVYRQLAGFIGLAGPYDFLPLTKPYQKTVFGPESNYPASQPILFVDGTEPPLLLLYGDEDTVVKAHNLVNLAARVNSLKGQVETRRYPGVDHSSIVAALSSPLRDRYPVLNDISIFVRATATTTSSVTTAITAPE
ncbi:MAG: alpha/beta hydrolase [Halieaceae bacterium]